MYDSRSLESYCSAVCTEDARDYYKEAILNYHCNSFRSAIINLWISINYDIKYKIEDLAQQGNNTANSFIKNIRDVGKDDYKGQMRLEKKIVKCAKDLEIVSQNDFEYLEELNKIRNK